jgi:carboxylesterase 2
MERFVSISLILINCCFLIAPCQAVLIIQLRPMVNIPKLGLLLGSQTKSSAGKGIYAFRGIPYAQSPVGELRFKVGIKKY